MGGGGRGGGEGEGEGVQFQTSRKKSYCLPPACRGLKVENTQVPITSELE